MSTTVRAFGDVIFGQTRGRVLALLCGAPERVFFGREIARLTRTSAGTTKRELDVLRSGGILIKSTAGRDVYYRANTFHPAFPELQALVAKTVGVYQQLTDALEPLKQKIVFAAVYGSIVRGDWVENSDIDVLIIGDISLDEVLSNLGLIESRLGRPINPTVFSTKEFLSRRKRGNHFLEAVLRGKIVVLIGDEHELTEMGRV